MPATARESTGDAVQAPPDRTRLLIPLGLSAFFLALQAALTDYSHMDSGAAGRFWLAVGCLLLVAVYRARSRVARGVIVVSAFVGVVIYGLVTLTDSYAVLVALSFLGQALPLLTKPVRQHVRRHD
ncbi:hypothetical protein O2W18_18235 [Modestobacter sp. VKM Ac-2983]|uniref:hypothetical protein n=1 Tax=Modestobacter sp. VKM Ac-2983 TaxID=3004137 RepID=UPI0022ABB114|nr:hypothetical protein [Modestobacter sp. VKM Ac-2983]MCZ2807050.1 hypothetical protein [Modestobacter sp. VKM Ac-2983]